MAFGKNITPADIFIILGYALLIIVYGQHLETRQSIAAVLGYTLLLIGKRLEFARGKDDLLTKRTKQAGYGVLFFSPSFTHWYDAFAIVGYAYCLFGMFDESTPPLSIYYILGAEQTTSHLSMVARSVLGIALMMGYKSPLQ